jgi:hypothetical protein
MVRPLERDYIGAVNNASAEELGGARRIRKGGRRVNTMPCTADKRKAVRIQHMPRTTTNINHNTGGDAMRASRVTLQTIATAIALFFVGPGCTEPTGMEPVSIGGTHIPTNILPVSDESTLKIDAIVPIVSRSTRNDGVRKWIRVEGEVNYSITEPADIDCGALLFKITTSATCKSPDPDRRPETVYGSSEDLIVEPGLREIFLEKAYTSLTRGGTIVLHVQFKIMADAICIGNIWASEIAVTKASSTTN